MSNIVVECNTCESSESAGKVAIMRQFLCSMKIMRKVQNMKSNCKLNTNERSFKRKKFKVILYSLTEKYNAISNLE